MIRRDRGDLVAECDECGDTSEGTVDGERDFLAFVAAIKQYGWRIRKVDEAGNTGEAYEHLCPGCAEG